MTDSTNQGIHQLRVLGSGTSTGVPVIGCGCRVCQHPDAKNRRLRSSIFLQTAAGKCWLVDAGPDLRTQLLRENICQLDALILTHGHADHCHGIDDLRPLSLHRGRALPVYTDRSTMLAMAQRFPYIFQDSDQPPVGGGIPLLQLVEVAEGAMTLGGERVEFFKNPHGSMETLALIHGRMAYIVDCHEIVPAQVARLRERELELLIIDCVRIKPHATHLHLAQALEYARAIAPRYCGLTHLGHDFEHNQLQQQLDRDFAGRVFALYDGQVLRYGV